MKRPMTLQIPDYSVSHFYTLGYLVLSDFLALDPAIVGCRIVRGSEFPQCSEIINEPTNEEHHHQDVNGNDETIDAPAIL